MDMMDMGMSMSGDGGTFKSVNSALAANYWYITVALLAFTFSLRIFNFVQTRVRLRLAKSRAVEHPTKPQNFIFQVFATGSTILREISAPEFHIRNRWFSWLSPPALGRSLVILMYFVIITLMLTIDAIIWDPYYYERIAFRAAWISVTQVPMVYLLATKSNVIGFLSGSSHERLNWMHRWVSRTMLVTVTIHGGFFMTEWWRADFIALELQVMPMVKYGLGAWAILVWTFLSSLTPIRRLSYEFFVIQHLASAAVFLWLLWVHVPAYAMYNVWWSIAVISFDKAVTYGWTAYTNINIRRAKSNNSVQRIGQQTEIRAVDPNTTEVLIRNVSFKWSPGQHIYLRCPTIGPWEAHPFTIANAHQQTENGLNDIHLVIESKTGFTRRLHRRASKAPGGQAHTLTSFVTGPFGCPPAWQSFETLLLISATTGTSFTLPILESLVSPTTSNCTRRIDFLVVVRRKIQVQPYIPRLKAALAAAEAKGIEINVRIAVTCERCGCCGPNCRCAFDGGMEQRPKEETSKEMGPPCGAGDDSDDDIIEGEALTRSSSGNSQDEKAGDGVKTRVIERTSYKSVHSEGSTSPLLYSSGIQYTRGRPDIEDFIRRPIELTGGETSVAVCGGPSIVSCVRNHVAALSDERGVHKGTGAQGIHLFTEYYCF